MVEYSIPLSGVYLDGVHLGRKHLIEYIQWCILLLNEIHSIE